ncbi:MAG: DUF131 domain-containing protein [Candidatus Atabeyarchaeum deiterrae]
MNFLSGELILAGMLILLVGIAFTIAGIIAALSRRSSGENSGKKKNKGSNRKSRGGGVILIGPIPILFGTDRKALAITICLVILLVFLYLMFLLGHG